MRPAVPLPPLLEPRSHKACSLRNEVLVTFQQFSGNVPHTAWTEVGMTGKDGPAKARLEGVVVWNLHWFSQVAMCLC